MFFWVKIVIIGSGNVLVQNSDKPLTESMMTQFTVAYMRHKFKGTMINSHHVHSMEYLWLTFHVTILSLSDVWF